MSNKGVNSERARYEISIGRVVFRVESSVGTWPGIMRRISYVSYAPPRPRILMRRHACCLLF